MFIALKEHGFSQPNIDQFNEVLSVTVLNDIGKIPLGLVMHFTEMYMEELAKVRNKSPFLWKVFSHTFCLVKYPYKIS